MLKYKYILVFLICFIIFVQELIKHRIMITVQDLIDYANEKELEIEYSSPAFNRWGEPLFERRAFFGFEFKPDVYYWWEIFTDENGEVKFVFFDHRYNRVNGATIKSFSKGYNAEIEILKTLNKY